MTLIIGVTTASGLVLSADSRTTQQVLDGNRVVLHEQPATGEKIWLLGDRLAVASCGAASIDVPGLMARFAPATNKIDDIAQELLLQLKAGVVPKQPWVVYLASLEEGAPTLSRISVPDTSVAFLSQPPARAVFRVWAEGLVGPDPLPADTHEWTVEKALAYSRCAITEAAQRQPKYVGPPVKSILVSTSAIQWCVE